MKTALHNIEKKGLGVLVIKNSLNSTTGILTDGDIKRLSNLKINYENVRIKKVMTKKPISVDKNMLAANALSIMNTKKIISLFICEKKKPIGIVHIHDLLRFTS